MKANAESKSGLMFYPAREEGGDEGEEPPPAYLATPKDASRNRTPASPPRRHAFPSNKRPIQIAPTAALDPLRWPAHRSRRRWSGQGQQEISVDNADVVVLYSLALGLKRGRPEDNIADEETAAVAVEVAAALKQRVGSIQLVPVWEDLTRALLPFDRSRHVVFNLCESLGGLAFTEAEVTRQLDQLGFTCTGTPFRAHRRCTNKLTTKRLLELHGIPTPNYWVCRCPADPVPATIRFPAIVKPIAEGGSFGIHGDSIVHDRSQLRAKVEECIAIYRQPALVEEFIAGREINIAMWGNRRPDVLPISEIVFKWTTDPLQQIVTFESKWIEGCEEYHDTPAICPAIMSPFERSRAEDAAAKAFLALGMRGYARVDVRLRDGIPYILEVNANPDLAPDAGFFRSASVAGYTYPGMALRILELALEARR